MARSKKGGMNWLTWRLNNPEKARAHDEAHDEAASELEQEITARVMRCRTCGTPRTTVPANEVPADVRESLEKSTDIAEFVYCPTCKEYSGLGEWNSF